MLGGAPDSHRNGGKEARNGCGGGFLVITHEVWRRLFPLGLQRLSISAQPVRRSVYFPGRKVSASRIIPSNNPLANTKVRQVLQ